MSTTIAGHTLTEPQRRTLDELLRYMREHCGDSGWTNTTSPAGDGRPVSVYEIFPVGSNANSAKRRTLYRLKRLGVLRACELDESRGEITALGDGRTSALARREGGGR